jgi:SNF2 family DNA or RNA helicase
MHILHANWSGGALRVWAEAAELWSRRHAARAGPAPTASIMPADPGARPHHPFAASAESLAAILEPLAPGRIGTEPTEIALRLPAGDEDPIPSAKLAHALGHAGAGAEADAATRLGLFRVPAVTVAPTDVCAFLDAVEDLVLHTDPPGAGRLHAERSIDFFAAGVRLVRALLAQQRFVPALRQELSGELRGMWEPWLADEKTAERTAALLRAMPTAVRAPVDSFSHEGWPILEDFLFRVLDAQCRRTLLREQMFEAVETRDPSKDLQVAWLTGILGEADAVPAPRQSRSDMIKGVRRWLGGLEERGPSSAWRLCLELKEPADSGLLSDLQAPPENVTWSLRFYLQSVETPDVLLEASDIWLLASDTVTLRGRRVDAPQELLLAELGRASRLYKPLEEALEDAEPTGLELNTKKAYEFLREVRPVLLEQGFGVLSPEWWDSPAVRLGARLKLDSEPIDARMDDGPGSASAAGARLGLRALVDYHWEIEIGGTTLSLREFEQLAQRRAPLVRVNGRWVEIRPEDVEAAVRFIRENPGGKMAVGEALRLAYATDTRKTGVPVVGMEATGWVAAIFGLGNDANREQLPPIPTPAGFRGTLRPYQVRGLSWLAFLERVGFGACLADDMGLGKTIQLLALLLHEREVAAGGAVLPTEPGPDGVMVLPKGMPRVPPTLLVVPTSVVGNWIHEARRFCPQLRVLIHHGPGRALGDAFVDVVGRSDMIVTTYALAHRDRELLQRIAWGRVVLDEAQYIKNPLAKQAQAVRSIEAERRTALTGTPVENRLSELWSIMDFLNPGYLGSAANFRKRFSVPIERYHDQNRGKQLRALIQPFILRRLKTDPTVVSDLPEKLESREYSHLTPEQAGLYESLVKRMLGQIEQSEGIQRRGLVLATLIKLKQVCNHPAQLLKDYDLSSGAPVSAARSGKCIRIIEMLDEVLSAGDQALVFTQFRQMGHLLSLMLRHDLDRECLFLHGGTTQTQRQAMVEQFQSGGSKTPILIVSLKAGGVGLNLTAATHVFHFDRWWNPAVENQATDRAYRIGQTRTVQVHKFVVRGTLEERIDEMIESKTELAEKIIGAGETWLTELSTDQLRDLLTLRSDAVGEEDEIQLADGV